MASLTKGLFSIYIWEGKSPTQTENIVLLILDEHTASLDPKTSETIMELTDKLIQEKGLTTLMVTHNLRYAVEYGNRLLMMNKGEAVIDAQDIEEG